MITKPHVSPAIVQIRGWVSFAAGLLCLCFAVQVLTFGIVHFTDYRYQTLTVREDEETLRVVEAAGAVRAASAAAARIPGRMDASGLHSAHDPNRVLSGADRVWRIVGNGSATLGSLAGGTLMIAAMLGVAVAAGGAVPGIQKAVKAVGWSVVLGVMCLPAGLGLADETSFGMLSGYDAMVRASESGVGEGELVARYALLPMAAMFVTGLVAYWFHSGVEAGVIVTSVSELDEAIEKEIGEIQKRGIGVGGVRAVGALNRALGDGTVEPPVDLMPSLLRGADGDGRRPI